MCLMLYIATGTPLAERRLPHGLAVQVVPPAREALLRTTFSRPHVRHVGDEGRCSCRVPCVIGAQPVEFSEGMFDPAVDRTSAIADISDILGLIRTEIASGGPVELLPVWIDEEDSPPMGRVELHAPDVDPARFVFTEQFLYVFLP